jgi:hypothetical protein
MAFVAIFKKEYHLMEMVQMSFRLDLSLMDVRNLEIFNRYGLKVYSMPSIRINGKVKQIKEKLCQVLPITT